MGKRLHLLHASPSANRSEEQSELCLKGDDTHRNANGAEYFRGGIIAWQEEDGRVPRKRLAVEVPLCYCKAEVKDDSNARLTRPSCCRGGTHILSLTHTHTDNFKPVGS